MHYWTYQKTRVVLVLPELTPTPHQWELSPRACGRRERTWNPWRRTNPWSSWVPLATSKFRMSRVGKKQVTRRCPRVCVPPYRFWTPTVGQAIKGHWEGYQWVWSGLLPGDFHSSCGLAKGPLIAGVMSCCLNHYYLCMHEHPIAVLLWKQRWFSIRICVLHFQDPSGELWPPRQQTEAS